MIEIFVPCFMQWYPIAFGWSLVGGLLGIVVFAMIPDLLFNKKPNLGMAYCAGVIAITILVVIETSIKFTLVCGS